MMRDVMAKELKREAWLTFRAEPELIKKLNQRARDEDRPRAWVIRRLLLRALETQEKTA